MSLFRSMYSAASGMGAHGDAIEVISDNVANINTVGYKASRSRFADILGGSFASAASEGRAGQGARLAGVDLDFNQGALVTTDVGTDMAIEGDGFFVVSGVVDGIEGQFYSRAGQFRVANDGRLLDPQGLAVQGYMANSQGTFSTRLTNVVVPSHETTPPDATSTVSLAANLDAEATVGAAFDAANPGATSNFSFTVNVYDSVGSSHNVDLFFRRSGVGAWEWHALVDGDEVTGGTPGTAVEAASGTLTFNTAGALDTETTTSSSFNFLGAAQAQSIAFDFGDSVTTDGGTGLSGVSSYAEASTVSAISQNGRGPGVLAGISVEGNGSITGVFTNGTQRVLGKVALASFRSTSGLVRAGGGLYSAGLDAGEPLIGDAGESGRGQIISGQLEQSTVDLSKEFVNLIAYQRGFQASSRAVTTVDEMLIELVNLKR